MKRIQIDAEGNLRCWHCGSRNFVQKRTKKGCLTLGLASAKKAKCQGCGAFNRRGRPAPFQG
jgi:DNA-directed RNA polymerase subunit RPC12/RpoP